jgi:hypothetical protein
VSLLTTPREPIWQVPFATTHLLEALLVMRGVFRPRPWKNELGAILDGYRDVTDAVRVQDGLTPVSWPPVRLDEDGPDGPDGTDNTARPVLSRGRRPLTAAAPAVLP